MHAESHVKTSRCIENVYVRHVENHIENHVEVRKKDHHTLRHMSKLSGRFRFSPSVLHELLKLRHIQFVAVMVSDNLKPCLPLVSSSERTICLGRNS